MNIAIDIRSLLDSQRTGVGEYTYQVLHELINNNTDDHYYLFYNSFSSHNIKKQLSHLPQKKITYCEFNIPNKIFHLLILFKIIKIDYLINKKFKTKIDYFWFPNISFIHVSKQCPYILTIHDLSFAINPKWYSTKRRLWHKILHIKKQIDHAQHIIAVSQSTKYDIQKLYSVSPQKISVTYLGLDQQPQKNLSPATFKNNFTPPSSFILSLCTLEPRKNLESLIEAFNKIASPHDLILIGGNGWKNKQLYKKIKHSPKKHKIHLLGYISKEQKDFLYSQADLFVFPSFFEGFGLPPLEALAYNAPVITSNVSSLPEILQQNAYYCNPYNIQSLLSMMNYVLEKQKKSQDKVLIRNNFLAHFNWYDTAQKTLQIIKKDSL